jgi:nitrite reductase/ring-hydroxylating ferredoxin subunit
MEEQAAPQYEWHDVCSLDEVPDGNILTRIKGGADLLVYRNGPQVTCMPNWCPHRGYPFDGSQVLDGVLICAYHCYEFRLDNGECLTDPGMPLRMLPVRIREGRVEVELMVRPASPPQPSNKTGV